MLVVHTGAQWGGEREGGEEPWRRRGGGPGTGGGSS